MPTRKVYLICFCFLIASVSSWANDVDKALFFEAENNFTKSSMLKPEDISSDLRTFPGQCASRQSNTTFTTFSETFSSLKDELRIFQGSDAFTGVNSWVGLTFGSEGGPRKVDVLGDLSGELMSTWQYTSCTEGHDVTSPDCLSTRAEKKLRKYANKSAYYVLRQEVDQDYHPGLVSETTYCWFLEGGSQEGGRQ